MTIALVRQVTAALAEFSSRSRLYEITIGEGGIGPAAGSLLVEAFAACDALQEVGYRDLIVLSTSDRIDLAALLGQPARVRRRDQRSRNARQRNSRVGQDKTVIDIVDAVFSSCQPQARWRWSSDPSSFMPRSYCCQYRETDIAFVQRLLVEENLSWRCEVGARFLTCDQQIKSSSSCPDGAVSVPTVLSACPRHALALRGSWMNDLIPVGRTANLTAMDSS